MVSFGHFGKKIALRGELMNDDAKKRAAEIALEFIEDGQILGLGTGSTTKFAIEGIGRMVQQGLKVRGIPTSKASAQLASELGIPLLDLNDVSRINITIDGSDECDPEFNLIKGGGGALTREKLVALASEKRVIIVDDSKLVEQLGLTRLLPVEVLPFAWRLSARYLKRLGGEPQLRMSVEQPFVTDNGNYILDCSFGGIAEPAEMERAIKLVPGVVENGLFIGIADTLVISFPDRVDVRHRPTQHSP